jgi:hypothetical protein
VSIYVLVIFSTVIPVFAASFDGIYNYVYNLNGPNGWEEHRVDGSFIVRSGVISSNPSAFSGTVDSSGNVRFTGPSPYGSPTATFTGTISSDGTGKGTYVDGQGLRGSWAVSRGSGGDADWISMFYNFIYIFSFVGELLGLSGRMAAIVGTAITMATGIVVVTVAVASVSTRGSKGGTRSEEYPGLRRGEYIASQPGELPRTQGAPASTIGIPSPPRNPPIGITTPVQELPDRLNLRSDWANQRASLSWNELQYDRGRYELQGFEVTQLYFDGSSTSSNRMIVDRLGPEGRYWNGPFNQTYRWNSGGDIQGYRVDALFKEISSDPPRYLRVGETSNAPYS